MVASSTLLVVHRSYDPDTNGGVLHTIGGARSCDPDTNSGAEGAGHVIQRAAALESCPIGYRILGYPQQTVLRLCSLPNLPPPWKKKMIKVKSSLVEIFFLIF